MNNEELCPCGSGKAYGVCCAPVIAGTVRAETPEMLMRARYSAYVTGEIAFLKASGTAKMQEDFDESSCAAWIRSATWHGLDILATDKGGPSDSEGSVEFRARYSANGEFCNHHELSHFLRENGEWKFDDGEFVHEKPIVREAPKVGRNDPCPCGSGKKYKKCCGAKDA